MSETNENITDQPYNDEPRSDAITNEPPPNYEGYELPHSPPPAPASKTWRYVLLAVGVPILLLCVVIGVIGLLITAITKVKEASGRTQSINNCKQMMLAMNNVAGNTTAGYIPPSYGSFPLESNNAQSFFMCLLPYVESNSLCTNPAAISTLPIKIYIAPEDPNNPGTSALMSYGSNATLLTVGGQPTFPRSFGGRTSGVIVVFERTSKSGATWSGSNNYLFDNNGSSSPEFGGSNSWSSYGTRATALASAGCVVGMGDASSRVVTQSDANRGWSWAMDPTISGGQPVGW